MKKHCAIVNPCSGNWFRKKTRNHYLQKLKKLESVEVFYTKHKGHASELSLEAFKKGFRSFIVFGGDGTVFETLNGLYPLAQSESICLGVFACGTGNSMIRDFEVNPKKVLKAICQENTSPCDVFVLKSKEKDWFFANLLSIGLVADIGKVRNTYFSKLGSLGYVLATLVKIPFIKEYQIQIQMDQALISEPYLFYSFNNTRYTGGKMMMAPHAIKVDGHIASVTAKPISKIKILALFPKIFKGTHTQLSAVSTKQVKTVSFVNTPKTDIMVDGEMICATPTNIKCVNANLKIYA